MSDNQRRSEDGNRVQRLNRRKSKIALFPEISKYQAFTILLVLVGCVLAVWFLTNKNSQTIYVNDTPFATIENKHITAEEFQNLVIAKLTNDLHTKVMLTDKITVAEGHDNIMHHETAEYVLAEICKTIAYTQEAGAIYVNGADIAVLSSSAEAKSLLDEIMAEYVPENATVLEKSFVDTVEVKDAFVDKREIMSREKVKSILTNQIIVEQSYMIAPGDNWWRVADRFGMSLNDFFEINPSITSTTLLKANQTLALMVYKPFLSVKTVEQMRYANLTPFMLRFIDKNEVAGLNLSTLQVKIFKTNGLVEEIKLANPTA